jgi:hypothetical protein
MRFRPNLKDCHPYRYGVIRLALPLPEKKAVDGALVDVSDGGDPRPCLAVRNFGLAHVSLRWRTNRTRATDFVLHSVDDLPPSIGHAD